MPRHTSITTKHSYYTKPTVKVIDIADERLLAGSEPSRIKISNTNDPDNWINNSDEII